MNKKLTQLTERRNGLVAHAEAQRLALTQNLDIWRKPMVLADQGLVALGFIKRHPVLFIGGAVTLLIVLRNSPAGKWLGHGWVMWQTIRKLRDRSNR